MTRGFTILGSAHSREPAPGGPFFRVRMVRRAAVSLVCLAYLLSACRPSSPNQNTSPAATVNPVAAGGLREAVALEILVLDESQGNMDYESQIHVTESEELGRLIDALDTELPLRPPSRCIPRYRLQFALPNGDTKGFTYSCEGGEAILRGEQGFWSEGEVTAPEEFQAQLHELFERRTITPQARIDRGLASHPASGGSRR